MTAVSKNMYIDKLDDIVNEYNNEFHRTSKMKPFELKITHILTLLKTLMVKILNLKVVIMFEYQNTKIVLPKDILQIGLKKFLWLKELKMLVDGHILLMISMVKKLLKHFMKKNYKKQINNNLG